MDKKNLFRASSLERISSPEQLNSYIKVISPSVVLMIVALVVFVIGGAIWGLSGTIQITKNETGVFCGMENACDKVVCIIPMEDLSEVKVGMKVQVSPDTASRTEYGYTTGSIESIGRYPVSEKQLLEIIENEELTRFFMQEGLGVQVIIQLNKDGTSQNGLQWSTEAGSAVNIYRGLTCGIQIILKNQKPVELIFSSGKE